MILSMNALLPSIINDFKCLFYLHGHIFMIVMHAKQQLTVNRLQKLYHKNARFQQIFTFSN